MVTRIAKGTASAKASGSTLTVSNVALNSDSAIIVALGYDDAQGHPTSVKWGNRNLKSRISRNPAGFDIAMSVWTAGSVRDTATRDIVATWSGNITERAMVVTAVEGVNKINEKAGNNHAVATTDPVTGGTVSVKAANDFVFCFFVSEGPDNNDTVGTAEIKDVDTFTAATLGQRRGTNGAPPVSNVTVTETFLQLTSCEATEGRLTGATSRLWTNAIITMTPLSVYVKYTHRGKCPEYSQILWTTDDISSVGCRCGNTVLHADGTSEGGLLTATDAEHETEFLIGYAGAQFDDILLIEI